jgi:hypothetical protein
MPLRPGLLVLLLCTGVLAPAGAQTPSTPAAPIVAVKAGRLIDPETGTSSINQVIVIEGERIKAVGPNLPIPAGRT